MKMRYIYVLLTACLMIWPAGCADDAASGSLQSSPSADANGNDDASDLDAQDDSDASDGGGGDLADSVEDIGERDGLVGDDTEDTRDEDINCSGQNGCSDADDPSQQCGDGDVSLGEACDDGNTDSGDGCDSSCEVEAGWICEADQPCETFCGDSLIAGDEQCDDGNRRIEDGCDDQCQIEPGYACPVPGDRCEAASCGDGIRARGEICDDGNTASGDGCNVNCRIEVDFDCPNDGGACVSTVECGDGRFAGHELCDDGNLIDGDGCDSTCQPEAGWRCQIPGDACEAARCGDGVVAGAEECDDGNTNVDDGCNALCKVEPGYTCPTAGAACVETTCGDGVRQGSEACDDGNNDMGDGCTPFCALEPTCPGGGGACSSSCGDGIRLPTSSKACEDGNTYPGDGCSPTCTVEPGFVCNDVTESVDELNLPLVIRDFSIDHPDFEEFSGSGATTGMVQDILGPDGKPVFRALQGMLDSQASFEQWYRDVPGTNHTFVQTLTLNEISPPGTFQFSNNAFFPVDGIGFGNEAGFGADHNYAFSTEARYWFVYRPGQVLTFTGDDDLWVYINKKLALDLGGLHPAVSGTVDLDAQKNALGLQDDQLYEVVVFHAERHSTGSNYTLTLGNFVNVTTECASICGDAIKTRDEACDDGVNDGSYGGCNPDCSRGPYCGDGEVEPELEQCDNGVNQDVYGDNGCTPDCRRPGYCGDGAIDSLFGEVCDDGNDVDGDGCSTSCQVDN